MNWKFEFTKDADKDLQKLDSQARKKILIKLRWFREYFDEITPLPLSGDWHGFFKFKIGDWRIVYEIDRNYQKIYIHFVGHRSKIYQRRTLKFTKQK